MQGLEHTPTKQTRSLVSAYIAGGATQDQIALVLQITDDTLRKHYEIELKTAKIVYTQKVVGKLDEHIENGSERAVFFYLTHQAKWSSGDKDKESDVLKEQAEALNRKSELDKRTEELRNAESKNQD